MWNHTLDWKTKRESTVHARRERRRPMFEALEGRVVLSGSGTLPDIAVISATEQDAHDVVVQYQVLNTAVPQSFDVAIDRSSNNAINSTSIQVGEGVASGGNLAVGTHSLTVAIPGALVIDPSHPFVIALANPNHGVAESNTTNNTASYRITTIAAVTHGFNPLPSPPAWVGEIAAGLKADGYDQAIAFNWAATSFEPRTGDAIAAGLRLANQIDTIAAQLPAGTVVDLHLIAHSRGSVVVDQAALDLRAMEQSGQHPELNGLKAGYTQMTLLDPHPATNLLPNGSEASFFNASSGPFGQMGEALYLTLQSKMQDPNITIPSTVNDTQVFYQHTNVNQAPVLQEQFFNIWGDVAIPGVNQFYDVTALTGGHQQVPIWYLNNVVPTLKNATTSIPGVSATSSPVAPPAPSQTGEPYELGVLESVTNSSTVAINLENLMGDAYSAYSSGKHLTMDADLVAFLAYVQLERGTHLQSNAADTLTEIAAGMLAGL